MQKGGDLSAVYARLIGAINKIERQVKFSHDKRLGYLTFCPTNLGTTIRASVHVKLPKLAADLPKFEKIAGTYNLQVRALVTSSPPVPWKLRQYAIMLSNLF
jgi:arginine kinase